MRLWVFEWKLYNADFHADIEGDEIRIRIKHHVFTKRHDLAKIKRELSALENLEQLAPTNREPIPAGIRLYVWQRDQGCCISCGSKDRLEFDHIIPVALGGSSTDRNLQLLCERCNREKGTKIR